jgi:drug/metabolite transporter (DMT)-like permease
MLGVLLAGISSAFNEVAISIGKKQVGDGAVSYYSFGFVDLLFGTAIILALGVWFNDFAFSLASLPTFLPRVFLEIVQSQLTVIALVKADRSDYGFLRTLTIPLLLLVDIALGYQIREVQILGMGIIVLAIGFLFYREGAKGAGKWLVLATAVNAVATLSLYKYDITHFNSVAAEQGIICLILMLYFFMTARLLARENPLHFLRRPVFLFQTFMSGTATATNAFAYQFAPTAVIVASLRATATLFALLSGRLYFRESRLPLKIVVCSLIIIGVYLLV